jgi:alanine racemase
MLYQTQVKIHLENIQYNIEGIRNKIGDKRKILVAVKANAYGHGAVEVSRLAEEIGVDFLGVATVPEGIELRNARIRLPILKFSPTFPEEMASAIENRLTLTVCDRPNINRLQETCQEIKKKVTVHLKIDTGMGRIGVTPEEAPELALHISRSCPNLQLEGLFTHLPVSDSSDTTYTKAQISNFKHVVEGIQVSIGQKISLMHCANSGGVLGHPDSALDMVRPGIMVYGYYPDKSTPRTIPLRPGLSFYSRVSFIKKVLKGTSIGYGRTWIAPQDTWIGTIPVGYADGFNRLFSNRGRVLIGGVSYPIVGRVCMDQSMVDLGTETKVKVGDEVVLVGKSGDAEITCDEWAEKLNTITYEITSQINSRVPRLFTRPLTNG